MNKLSLSQIAELVDDCVADLYRTTAEHALLQMEIDPHKIPGTHTNNLQEYYLTLIRELAARDFLVQWLEILAQKEHLTFAKEWLQRIKEPALKILLDYLKDEVFAKLDSDSCSKKSWENLIKNMFQEGDTLHITQIQDSFKIIQNICEREGKVLETLKIARQKKDETVSPGNPFNSPDRKEA